MLRRDTVTKKRLMLMSSSFSQSNSDSVVLVHDLHTTLLCSLVMSVGQYFVPCCPPLMFEGSSNHYLGHVMGHFSHSSACVEAYFALHCDGTLFALHFRRFVIELSDTLVALACACRWYSMKLLGIRASDEEYAYGWYSMNMSEKHTSPAVLAARTGRGWPGRCGTQSCPGCWGSAQTQRPAALCYPCNTPTNPSGTVVSLPCHIQRSP